MVDNNTNNDLLQDIIIDLSQIFDLPFKEDLKNDQEIAAESRRVAGMLVQPVEQNTSQYQTAKGYYQQKGASEQSAGTLALIVSNIAKLSGRSINSIVRQLEGSNISFNDQTYIAINNLRNPQSQWFRFIPTRNERAFVPAVVDDCVCLAPIALAVNCEVDPPTNLILEYIVQSFGILQFTPYQSVVDQPVITCDPVSASFNGGACDGYAYIQFNSDGTFEAGGGQFATDVPGTTGDWNDAAPATDGSLYEITWLAVSGDPLTTTPAAEGVYVDLSSTRRFEVADSGEFTLSTVFQVTIREIASPSNLVCYDVTFDVDVLCS